MLPKKIHYCWFGRNPLPESAKKCIASWRKFFPDYEIIEWNEDNFDVNSIPYTREACEAKKYAFVSDYARYAILYDQGGIYFDTDVEVIRPMEDILRKGPYMGFEINPGKERRYGAVNPGLGFAAYPGMKFFQTVLNYYRDLRFILLDGKYNEIDAIVNITTRELVKAGLSDESGIQEVEGVTVYPADYFNPLDDATGKLNLTENSYSIHWFSRTWMPHSRLRIMIGRIIRRILKK